MGLKKARSSSERLYKGFLDGTPEELEDRLENDREDIVEWDTGEERAFGKTSCGVGRGFCRRTGAKGGNE